MTDPLSSAAALSALVQAATALANLARALQGNLSQSAPPAPSLPPARLDSPPLVEAINQFIVAKARAGRSDRYLRQIRSVLSGFCQGRARKPLASLVTGDIERYALRQELAPRTQAGHVRDLRCFLAWCQRRGLVAENVALEIEPPSHCDRRAIQIHTPDQAAQILECARAADLGVCRHLSLRYFAGLRSAEAHRLVEANILLDRGFIEVPAAASKTRSRRLVKIQPALAAWLALGGELRPLSPNTLKRVVRASGVAFPHNVTRHSWCSYHLAHFENAGRTALEAGHAEAILFRHYRALVTPEASQSWWALRPATKSDATNQLPPP